jgi:hypothetical protein
MTCQCSHLAQHRHLLDRPTVQVPQDVLKELILGVLEVTDLSMELSVVKDKVRVAYVVDHRIKLIPVEESLLSLSLLFSTLPSPLWPQIARRLL